MIKNQTGKTPQPHRDARQVFLDDCSLKGSGLNNIRRIYTERQANNATLEADIKQNLGITVKVRVFTCYDVSGLLDEYVNDAIALVFSSPSTNVYMEELPVVSGQVFAVENLPERIDKRVDFVEECLQLLTQCDRPTIRCSTVYAIEGTEKELAVIKKYLVNPVESRIRSLDKPTTLEREILPPEPIRLVDGFTHWSVGELEDFYKKQDFAMTVEDLIFVQSYFKNERREPTYTELKVIDAYWSESCRRTTFSTALTTKIKSQNPHIQRAYADYTQLFNLLYDGRADKYPSLMDVATIGAKALKRQGYSTQQNVSFEENACAVKYDVVMRNGEVEPWYILFKSVANVQSTDTESLACGSECFSTAVCDPLSNRGYVYQAMRVTGASDKVFSEKTTVGKTPQRVICKRATNDSSSYANQAGIATGEVKEYYHSGYSAKRFETEFAVGAVRASDVISEEPKADDIVVLLGGSALRCGCNASTVLDGTHNAHSGERRGVDLSNVDAITVRKLQRLMRNGEFTRLIKRCSAVGIGGVAVAVGKLAYGIDIDLSAVPQKCRSLSATEIAVSKSQERLAAVVAPENRKDFVKLANAENIDATVIAKVTENKRLRMFSNGNLIVDIERKFLDSNGVRKEATAVIKEGVTKYFGSISDKRKTAYKKRDYKTLMCDILSDCNVCSQKGLTENFDSSIGGGSVFMPFGGRTQLTPSGVSVAKLSANTDYCTVCSHGFNPELSEKSPFLGGMYSVIIASEKLAAVGVRPENTYLAMQEIFSHCSDSEKWGASTSALLGALTAQLKLKRAVISENGLPLRMTEKSTLPPTTICFGCGVMDSAAACGNVFYRDNEKVYRYKLKRDKYGVPDFDNLNDFLMLLAGEIGRGNIRAATVVERGGAAATVIKSCFGNHVGFAFDGCGIDLFEEGYGDIVFAARHGDDFYGYDLDFLGTTTEEFSFTFGGRVGITLRGDCIYGGGTAIDGCVLEKAFTQTFESVYPTMAVALGTVKNISYDGDGVSRGKHVKSKSKTLKVFIPVFTGINGEYDMARRFELAGAEPEIFVVKNRTAADVQDCVKAMVKALNRCKILALPSGLLSGGEPIDNAKLVATLFSNPQIAEAIENLLYKRDGLAIGVGSGLSTLVKLGLLPFGHVKSPQNTDPVLTYNTIPKHVSTLVDVRVASNYSPWLSKCAIGETYTVPFSHCLGRFVADDDVINTLIANGQIATQYCDLEGNATTCSTFNPNGSVMAIEGIVSPDGRILGKTGNSERINEFIMKNAIECYAKTDMLLFEAGVEYFK